MGVTGSPLLIAGAPSTAAGHALHLRPIGARQCHRATAATIAQPSSNKPFHLVTPAE
jgi:hypothetical protein